MMKKNNQPPFFMKKVYFIPNVITAFGLSCGLFVIFKVSLVEGDITSIMPLMVSLLLVAAFADLLDGVVARAMRAESEFGVIFDTLSDAVTFGIAPSVLMIKTLPVSPSKILNFIFIAATMVYALCGILRLVRFNVKASQAKHNVELELSQKKHFTGLPIPAAAITSLAINFNQEIFQDIFDFDDNQLRIFLSIVQFMLGYLMISRIKFPSSKALHFKMPSFQLVFVAVLGVICSLYGVLYYFKEGLFIISSVYILVALTLNIIRKIAGKKSKTLVDYEPEDEDL
jgi:CDP-diacylglycerol--serine O-phosphatidyltransferase